MTGKFHHQQVAATAILSLALYVLWEKWKETPGSEAPRPLGFWIKQKIPIPLPIRHQLGANQAVGYKYVRKRCAECQRRIEMSGEDLLSLVNEVSGYVIHKTDII